MSTASRRSPLSEHKTAHRDLSVLRNTASAPTRSQALIASAKTARCVTIARRTPLLPQGNQQQPPQCLKANGSVGNDTSGSFLDPNVIFAGVDVEGYLLVGGGIQLGGFYDRSTGNFGAYFSLDLGGGLGSTAGGVFGAASNLSSFQGPTSVVGAGVGPISANYITQPGSLRSPVGASVGVGANAMPPLPLPAQAHASKSFTNLFATSLPPC
jgi:hypothetical protein